MKPLRQAEPALKQRGNDRTSFTYNPDEEVDELIWRHQAQESSFAAELRKFYDRCNELSQEQEANRSKENLASTARDRDPSRSIHTHSNTHTHNLLRESTKSNDRAPAIAAALKYPSVVLM